MIEQLLEFGNIEALRWMLKTYTKEETIEVKGSARVHEGDVRSLRTLREDCPVRHMLIVCMESQPRTLEDGIEILPWKTFLERLWGGKYGV